MKTLTLLFALLFSISVFADNACLDGGQFKMVDGEKVRNSAAEVSACIAKSEDANGCGSPDLVDCKCITGTRTEGDAGSGAGTGVDAAGDTATRGQ